MARSAAPGSFSDLTDRMGAVSREQPPREPTHDRLLAVEARRLLTLNSLLPETSGAEVIWFVVDITGSLGRFCAEEIVGPRETRVRAERAAVHSIPASFCFPLDGAGALVAMEHLAPALLNVVLLRPAGEIPIVVIDRDDRPALAWLHDLTLVGRA
jgi:hypothetical protein